MNSPRPLRRLVTSPLRLLLRALRLELVVLRRSRLILEDLHARQGSLFFVQIGANDGVRFDDLYGFVTSLPKCRGLVVEPLPDFFEILSLNYRDYPLIRPVRTALHPTLREVDLFRVARDQVADLDDWTAGTASLDREHHRRLGTPNKSVLAETVPACTFMELCERENVSEIDYLQIDTEGFDWQILQMIDFATIRPRVIKYEVINLSAADGSAADAHLRSFGYRTFAEGGMDRVAVLRRS